VNPLLKGGHVLRLDGHAAEAAARHDRAMLFLCNIKCLT